MRVATITKPFTVEIQEQDIPKVGPGDVLIKVKCCGICGSDLHLFKGTHAFRKLPAVLGHEVSGEVVKIGEKVGRIKLGDRVTVEPQVGCGACYFCRNDMTNLCLNKKVPGTPTWLGTFADYFLAPEQAVYKLSDFVSYDSGALVEPLAVAVHAMNRIDESKIADSKTIAVLGCGTIGLLVLAIAKQKGYGQLFGTDTAPFNRKLALDMGANAAYDPLNESPSEEINTATGEKGVDVCIVAAGASNIIDQASSLTKKGGQIILVSMMTKPIPVYTYGLVFKEQVLAGSMTYSTSSFAEACRLMNNGLNVEKIVTHHLSLEESQHGLEILNEKKEDAAKILVRP